MKTNRIKALVVVEGGCVSDVLSLHPVEYDIWDWDNFQDDPVSYWEDRADQDDLKELFASEVLADILERYAEAKAYQAENDARDAARAVAVQSMN